MPPSNQPTGPTPASGMATALQPLNVALAQIAEGVKKLADGADRQRGAVQKAEAAGASFGAALGRLSNGLQQSQQLVGAAFNQITQFTGAIRGAVAGFVELYQPATVKAFTLAVNDLTASIGRALEPLLKRLTVVVRGVGDAVAALDGPARTMLTVLAAASVGMVVFAGGVQAVNVAIAAATGGVSVLVGALVGGLAGGLASLGVAGSAFDSLKQVVGQFAAAAKAVLDVVGGEFQKVVGAVLTPLAKALSAMGGATGPIVQMVQSLGGVLASVAGVVASFLPTLVSLGQAFMAINAGVLQVAVVALMPFVELLKAIAPVVSVLLAPLTTGLQILGTVAQVIGQVGGVIMNVFLAPMRYIGEVIADVSGIISGAFGKLQGAFREVGTLAGEVASLLKDVLAEVGNELKPLLDDVKDVFLDVVKGLADAVKDIASFIKNLVRDIREFLGIPEAQPVAGAGEGLAVRNVSTGSVDSVLAKARESAFGIGKDPPTQTAANTAKSAAILERIEKAIGEALSSLPEKVITLWLARMKRSNGPVADAVDAVGGPGAWAARAAVNSIIN